MDKIKGLITTLFGIILTLSLVGIFTIMFARELTSHSKISSILKESHIIENSILGSDQFKEVPQELIEYIDIEDIMYDYMADEIRYQIGAIEERPEIDIKELNKRLKYGINKYIDDQVSNKTGGLDKILGAYGINIDIDAIIKSIVGHQANIDLNKDELVTKQDLLKVYETVDEKMNEVRKSTYAFDAAQYIYKDGLLFGLIGAAVLSFAIISLVNFNALSGFVTSSIAFGFNTVAFFGIALLAANIKFKGDAVSDILNSIVKSSKNLSFKYTIISGIIFAALVMISVALKRYNILKSHRTGKATLDTIFDDYDEQSVIEELNRDSCLDDKVENNIKEIVEEVEKKPKEKKNKKKKKEENVSKELDIPNVKTEESDGLGIPNVKQEEEK